MTTPESGLLVALLLSMLLGVLGQGIRSVVGIKKLSEEAEKKKTRLRNVFDATVFAFSLFIGALAGAVAYFGLWLGAEGQLINLTNGATALGILAAGYAGTDFVEAFAKKYLPE